MADIGHTIDRVHGSNPNFGCFDLCYFIFDFVSLNGFMLPKMWVCTIFFQMILMFIFISYVECIKNSVFQNFCLSFIIYELGMTEVYEEC